MEPKLEGNGRHKSQAPVRPWPLATKVYSPLEWEKRRKRQQRAAAKRKSRKD